MKGVGVLDRRYKRLFLIRTVRHCAASPPPPPRQVQICNTVQRSQHSQKVPPSLTNHAVSPTMLSLRLFFSYYLSLRDSPSFLIYFCLFSLFSYLFLSLSVSLSVLIALLSLSLSCLKGLCNKIFDLYFVLKILFMGPS